ncbi:hypothetical protein [Plesiomonas shigelloides]|uniref:hypothetical protein n=1 Tax=Plesiomonas shigelloides TaxID=703 RepID=UPI0014838401|nr:hypothetical protein [Plesiomonas shigelloides]
MQLHLPLEIFKFVNENRKEKSQQTFIIELIADVMNKQQETVKTEGLNGQKQQQ